MCILYMLTIVCGYDCKYRELLQFLNMNTQLHGWRLQAKFLCCVKILYADILLACCNFNNPGFECTGRYYQMVEGISYNQLYAST